MPVALVSLVGVISTVVVSVEVPVETTGGDTTCDAVIVAFSVIVALFVTGSSSTNAGVLMASLVEGVGGCTGWQPLTIKAHINKNPTNDTREHMRIVLRLISSTWRCCFYLSDYDELLVMSR